MLTQEQIKKHSAEEVIERAVFYELRRTQPYLLNKLIDLGKKDTKLTLMMKMIVEEVRKKVSSGSVN